MAITAQDTTSRDVRRERFLKAHNVAPESCNLLAGDASFRKYWRISHQQVSRVLMDAPPEHEDILPFINVTQMLRDAGLYVPRIFAHDTHQGWVILEDLGDGLFARVLARRPELEPLLYTQAVENLLLLHDTPEDIYASLSPYDTQVYLREISLFADWYLPQAIGGEKAAALRHEYLSIWQEVLEQTPLQQDVLVHRDYHAENLLWMPQNNGLHRVGILDYQDALRGDAAYDLVSLIEDARRDVTPATAKEIYHHYVHASGEDPAIFQSRYQVLGAQRNSKIIGIFTRLAVRDSKPNYLALLPRVWAHLERDMRHPSLKQLREWVQRNVPASRRKLSEVNDDLAGLTP